MMKSDMILVRPDEMRVAFPGLFGDCRYTDIGTGWRMLVDGMCKVFAAMPSGSVSILDLKEKFGALRAWVVTDGLTPEEDAEVVLAKYLAEERSRFVCEVCGNSGLIRRPKPPTSAWIRCRCEEHATAEELTWMPDRRQHRRQLHGIAYV